MAEQGTIKIYCVQCKGFTNHDVARTLTRDYTPANTPNMGIDFAQGTWEILGKRSQGSRPWPTQTIALGEPLLAHFPLALVSPLRYNISNRLTLLSAAWRRHGTAG